ncbi:MAG: hypothetical protein A2562_00185 [Candidatus Nealsonbacteria bacterium RIFOXYD1_FULL_39_11]|nr:MAG: hypothetical protein A2562_00185 [Candidatus Nealsonbacteria bacterium RIFOXYD1_FULL_39_11]
MPKVKKDNKVIVKKPVKPNKKVTLKKLEKLLGDDKELVLFFLTWLKHNRNATKAYLELHPNVTYQSATVLGSKLLGNISIEAITTAYGLTYDVYFKQLEEGIHANRKRAEVVDRDKKGAPIYAYVDEPDHQTRKGYHDKLGKLLGIERDAPQPLQQFNFNFGDEIAKARKRRGLKE